MPAAQHGLRMTAPIGVCKSHRQPLHDSLAILPDSQMCTIETLFSCIDCPNPHLCTAQTSFCAWPNTPTFLEGESASSATLLT